MLRFCGISSGLVLLVLTGCTTFDHDNDGTTRRVLLGKKFTISIPPSDDPGTPRIDDLRVAVFLEHRLDMESGMNVYEFRATQVGETEIHIPRQSSGIEFGMTIIVVLGGTLSP